MEYFTTYFLNPVCDGWKIATQWSAKERGNAQNNARARFYRAVFLLADTRSIRPFLVPPSHHVRCIRAQWDGISKALESLEKDWVSLQKLGVWTRTAQGVKSDKTLDPVRQHVKEAFEPESFTDFIALKHKSKRSKPPIQLNGTI
jgi:hypothetical protein